MTAHRDKPALTRRQAEMIALTWLGLPNTEIARRLCLTASTVRSTLHNAYERLGVDIAGSPRVRAAVYLWQVCARLEVIRGVHMGRVPRPPIDDLIAQTVRNKVAGTGFDWMDHDRQPGATVLHSMAGTLNSCINYFPLPTTDALTDFGIGQVNHNNSGYARIVQFNDIHGRREGYASGPVRIPEGDGPRWLQHIGGAGAVNEVGVSIEHDDTTRANGTAGPLAAADVTAFQWASSVWLQAWLHAEVFGQTAASYDWNLHHREICGHDYKDCPRPRIYAHTDEYQTVVKAIMAKFQDGVPYPAAGLRINGLRIKMPLEEIQPYAHDPGWLDPLVDTFDWQGAGIVTYRKVRAYNDRERVTYEREWDAVNGYGPWKVVS